MKVHVKYFAGIRESIGTSGESVETTATTLALLRDQLIAQGGAYANSLARGHAVRMAINQVMREEAATFQEGDEIAFFPPVTGG